MGQQGQKHENAQLEPRPGDALLVVDVQNDFLPGGSLAVPAGDEVVDPLNRWLARFAGAGLCVYASRDWHPSAHCSFQAQGGPWPPHCIAGTAGADFAAGLALPPQAVVVNKGTRDDVEAYSAFAGTSLAESLRARDIHRLFVGGLATDYCVLNTVHDALLQGLEVLVLADGIRPVDVHRGDGEAAIAAMQRLGAVMVRDGLPQSGTGDGDESMI